MRKSIIAALLSFVMIAGCIPSGMMTVYAEEIEAPEAAELQTETEIETETEPEREVMTADASFGIDKNIKNGKLELSEQAGRITGRATPDSGYALASVRVLNGNGSRDIYVEFNEKDNSFSINKSEIKIANPIFSATFYNLKVWDGAVDVSWYDPEMKSFDISTPAQLAGLAAIVNGMVDENETSEDQIYDPGGRSVREGSWHHKHINTVKEKTLLIEQQGGGVEDVVYRLPAVRTKGIFASDDLYDDMKYRTVNITADINMGSKNFSCIGGKHAMNTAKGVKDPKVIDTRFHGVLDGHGHTVTINCNKYSYKGFAYAWNIGLVGYLGGAVDRENSDAKDNIINYAKENHPTVRNVVVKGSVLGRRCVGGVVGRIGETNYSCVVENCANYATVKATDMRGSGGIVGAAWGRSVIRNCYNAGDIYSQYAELGGIVASNGYKSGGADVLNCFNVGSVRRASVSSEGVISGAYYNGREIGTDGNDGKAYTLRNCFYVNPEKSVEKTGYDKLDNSKIVSDNVQGMSLSSLNSQSTIDKLNSNGRSFVRGSKQPLLYFEKKVSSGNVKVTVSKTDNGAVSVNAAGASLSGQGADGSVPYGTSLTLTSAPADGYRLGCYTVNGCEIDGDYYVVTEDTVIGAKFVSVEKASLKIPAHDNYSINVTRTYSGKTHSAVSEKLSDGAELYKGDKLKVTGTLQKGAAPADVNYEYSGKFKSLAATDPSSVEILSRTELQVTGKGNVEIQLSPEILQKDWITIGDTSWYKGHEKDKTYTIRNAKQLAGMAKLICDGKDEGGTDFAGKTIVLASDIDLSNADGTTGKRLWRTVGNPYDTFKGTFDGAGHTISNIYVSFLVPVDGHIIGSHGGLFGVTKGAVIRNVTVNGMLRATAGDTGVIVGNAIDTRIENCTSNVEIVQAKETGGIVGKAEGATVIKNCTNKGRITGTERLGGIVSTVASGSSSGSASGSTSGSVQIISCSNRAAISSSHKYVGGIVSFAETGFKMSECINMADISAAQNVAPGEDNGGVGGLIGTSEGAIEISRCVNTGNISGTNYLDYAGGLVGYINSKSQLIESSYNTGTVSGGARTVAAGAANANASKKSIQPEITSCYSIGAVSSAKADSAYAFFGTGNAENCSDNYVVADTSGKAVGLAGAKSVTAATLKKLPAGLGDAYTADTKKLNNGFPVLKWQNNTKPGKVVITKVTNIKGRKAVIKWKKQPRAVGYQIYYSTKKSSGFKLAKTVWDSRATSYTKAGLNRNRTYYFKIRAMGTAADGAYSAVKAVKVKK